MTHPSTSKHRPTNNKHPLLLPPNPLHNPIRRTRQPRLRRPSRRHSIKLKHRRAPRKTRMRRRCLVMDLGPRGRRVQRCLQVRVQAEEFAAGQWGGEGGGEGGHDELDVAAGFVEEVP